MFKFLCASLLTMGLSSSVFAGHVNVTFTNSYTGSGTVIVNFKGGVGSLAASAGGSAGPTGFDLSTGTSFTASVPITKTVVFKGRKTTTTTTVHCTNNGISSYNIPSNDISIQITYSSGGTDGTCTFTAQ